jgi:exodeoxyribonuclease VII large subunit
LSGSSFQIFTIKEITQYIKHKLSSDKALQDIWVQGEISNFVHHSSGHFYFTLKDEQSQLPCAMFRWANEGLEFKLEDGMKIIARGSIDVYMPQGRYNFIISEVHPKGIGELYLRFLQLKEKLAKEGLFDVEFKKPIPPFPKKIGIITSPTGAALQDMINIMKRRFSCAGILLIPTLVQGRNASEDIVRSIHLLNTCKDVDVAILGRGGGSIEDLWPFNEEKVARAIFNSQVPIISAVGHESDFTISDFVADLRAATPSAAAELVVPDKNEVIRQINSQRETLAQNFINMLRMYKKHVEGISSSLRPKIILDRIIQYQQRTDDLFSKLTMKMDHNIELYLRRFTALTDMLDAVSPLATLKRGYSITLKLPEEYAVDTIEKVKNGDEVKVIIQDGEMKCKVDKVEKTELLKNIKRSGHKKEEKLKNN